MSTRTEINGFHTIIRDNGQVEVFNPIAGEWRDFPSIEAAQAAIGSAVAPAPKPITGTGWSNAAKARGNGRYEAGCRHSETSNTGDCYSCGQHIASANAISAL